MAAVLAAPAPGAAQGAAPAAEGTDLGAGERAHAQARAHFTTAMEHYRARRYREAIHEFRLSIAELPSAEVWFNIGRAHEQLGEYALAVEHYRLYLRDRVDAPDAVEVEQRVAELEGRRRAARAPGRLAQAGSGSLAIEASEPGALLLLDGETLGRSPVERVLSVTAGRHRLEASGPGRIPFRAEVDVQPGALSMAYVQLHPLAQPPSRRPQRLWTWIAAGASACALLTSGALGLVALDRRDEGAWREARRAAVASDLALGSGVGLAIAAALLYFIEADADESASARARAAQ